MKQPDLEMTVIITLGAVIELAEAVRAIGGDVTAAGGAIARALAILGPAEGSDLA